MNQNRGEPCLPPPDHCIARAEQSASRRKARQVLFLLPLSGEPTCAVSFEPRVACFIRYWFLIAPEIRRNPPARIPLAHGALWAWRDYLATPLQLLTREADAQAAGTPRKSSVHPVQDPARSGGTWIESLSAYFRDHDKVAVNVRWPPTMPRWSGLRKAIPTTRVQAFYALTRYSACAERATHLLHQIKSAACWRNFCEQNPHHPGVDALPLPVHSFTLTTLSPLPRKGKSPQHDAYTPALRRPWPHAPAMPISHLLQVGSLVRNPPCLPTRGSSLGSSPTTFITRGF